MRLPDYYLRDVCTLRATRYSCRSDTAEKIFAVLRINLRATIVPLERARRRPGVPRLTIACAGMGRDRVVVPSSLALSRCWDLKSSRARLNAMSGK